MHTFWLISPIIIVLGIALYFIWALRKRDRHYQTKKAIMKSGDRGEYKVQAVLRVLQKPNLDFYQLVLPQISGVQDISIAHLLLTNGMGFYDYWVCS